MRKILIADTSEEWRSMLGEALGERYVVRFGADGPETVTLLEQFEPDVLITDLMLSGTDGLSILKGLAQRDVRPKILVMGRYFSDFVTASLERFRVDDVMLKPCAVQDVVDRTEELLAQEEPTMVRCQTPYDHITALLVSLGAPTSQQGFRFLRTGILLLMEDPGQQLTKSLYPAIAQEYGTNPVNVEKALRTTVTAAWLNRRDSVWQHYFPPSPTGQIPKPTAGQFMLRLTDVVMGTRRWM